MGAKGHAKTGGRKKGSLNKDTRTLIDKARELKCDPFEIMLRFAAEDWKGLGYPERTRTTFTPQGIEVEEFIIPPALRASCAKEAARYIYAPRRPLDDNIDPEILEAIRALENKSDEELLAIVNQNGS